MAKKPMTFADELRKAIEECGESRYAISKGTGIPESTLSRFMSGRMGLSMASVELLWDHLGLTIATRPKSGNRSS